MAREGTTPVIPVPGPPPIGETDAAVSLTAQVGAGIRAVRREPGVRVLIALLGAQGVTELDPFRPTDSIEGSVQGFAAREAPVEYRAGEAANGRRPAGEAAPGRYG